MGAFTLPVYGDPGGPQFSEYGDTGFGPIGAPPTIEQGAQNIMNSFPPLPPLPTVSEAPAPANNGVKFEAPWMNKAASALNSATSSGGSLLKSILDIDLEDLIFIVLGLLLIGAGIFSFKQTQTIIREGGKAAATAAAAAA